MRCLYVCVYGWKFDLSGREFLLATFRFDLIYSIPACWIKWASLCPVDGCTIYRFWPGRCSPWKGSICYDKILWRLLEMNSGRICYSENISFGSQVYVEWISWTGSSANIQKQMYREYWAEFKLFIFMENIWWWIAASNIIERKMRKLDIVPKLETDIVD